MPSREERNIFLTVTGKTDDAQRALNELERDLTKFGNKDSSTREVRVSARKAHATLGELRRELETIDRSKVSPEMSVEISGALARLRQLQTRMGAIRDRKVVVSFETRGKLLAEIARAERDVHRLSAAFAKASRPAQSFGQRMAGVVQAIKSVTPVVNGLAIILLTSLVPGLIAVGASAASAAGGLGALGAALGASLIPTIGIAAALFSRMGKVMEAMKAKDAAREEAAAKTASGDSEAAQAAERRHAAEIQLRDALQSVVTAERNLAQARQQARDDITEANERVASAQGDLADANRDLAQATQDAYRAMRDAALDYEQALLDVESARLALRDAQMDSRKARQELAKWRKEVGLAGKSYDDVFKKFTDVDARFDKNAFGKALAQRGDGDAEKNAREGQRLAQNVAEAENREAQADVRLRKTKLELIEARRLNERFQREGIKAFGPYRQAIDDQKRATENLNKAIKERDRLEKVGIEGNPQVIAAIENLRDAEERLTEARRNRRKANRDDGTSAAAQKAIDKLKDLSAAERAFLEQLETTKKFLRGEFQGATDAVFGSMTRALQRLPQLLGPLRGAFQNLGNAWAGVIDTFSGELIKPEWTNALRSFTNQTATLTTTMGSGVFLSFLEIMRNLALVSFPLLNGLAQELAGWLGKMADKTANVSNTAGPINVMVESFRVWMKFLGSIVGLFTDLAVIAGPIGDDLVGWMTDGINSFRRWLKTAEGQKRVKKFFENTIPEVKRLIKFIIRLGTFLLEAFEAAAPFLGLTLDFLSGILKVAIGVLDIFNRLPGPIRQGIGAFFALRAVLSLANRLGLELLTFPKHLSKMGSFPGKIGDWLVKPFKEAVDVVKASATSIKDAAGKMLSSRKAGEQGTGFASKLVEGFKTAKDKMVTAATNIATAAKNAIVAGRQGLVNAGKAVGGALSRAFEATKTAASAAGAAVANAIGSAAGKAKAGLTRAGAALGAALRAAFAFGQAAVSAMGAAGRKAANLLAAAAAGSWKRLAKAGAYLGGIVTAAFNTAVAAVTGVGKAIGGLITKLRNKGKDMGSAGWSLGRAMMDGITNRFKKPEGSGIFPAARRLAQRIVTVVKNALGIRSPSRVFDYIGRMMIIGLLDGMSNRQIWDFIHNNLEGWWQTLKEVFSDDPFDAKGAFETLRGLAKWAEKNIDFSKLGKNAEKLGKALAKFGKINPVTGFFDWLSDPLGGPDFFQALREVTRVFSDPGGWLGDWKGGMNDIWDKLWGEGRGFRFNGPELARGGLVTGPTHALVGEGRHQEAVLPLDPKVMRMLASAITDSMSFPMGTRGMKPALRAAGVASQEITQNFHIPPAAAAHGQPDARMTAALMARELKRRGAG